MTLKKNSSASDENKKRRKDAEDFIYLAACALKNAKPEEERLMTMDFRSVMWLSRSHMMSAMVARALAHTEAFERMPKEQRDEWENIRYGAVRKQVFMKKERDRVFKTLEKAGIWYCPIKGMTIAALYPVPGIREMADCDVLVDEGRAEDIKNLMESIGYRTELYGESCHDVFHRQPVYNFEMHRQLFNEGVNPVFDAYYAHVKDRLVKDEGNAFGFHFSNEDEYIFNIAHSFKHYSSGGTGFRALTDVYVFRHRCPDMNEKYLKEELAKLELTEFEHSLWELAELIFERPDNVYRVEFTEDQERTLSYISGSGAYGTAEHSMHNTLTRLGNEERISAGTRVRYVFERLYPKGWRFEEKYPFFYKHKWAYPFLPLYRLHLRGDVKSIFREVRRMLRAR